jgi:hypothetical protein
MSLESLIAVGRELSKYSSMAMSTLAAFGHVGFAQADLRANCLKNAASGFN